ncbi:Zn(2)-C6 fungal-type DNA-binding domain protein [Metarhizium robertsii ARSEF 23]|uniref:Zn(2)-C6 fungal-type DNA-binding domain protein n=1 Tax=Metarhizium robertsii (strain ARSEF 23 / ATCC MYA-3075) TaxID=655844 RepID=E9FDS5_METRA|nr:Zn(2)-C6 fungal-type DNA-binding domain protein [Metarhizium robertsii ARSEF 23]EFY94120.1 Zn(2)-C6 fungal-type DNA-binding domain protein [Metarhizium robertsii ARSEF 23]
MNRSNNGCWTCRIRHRKCDEKHPICRECADRGITCHGYGPKPKWIDDEWKLQAELSRIKKTVNSNLRRKKKLQACKASQARPSEHQNDPRQEEEDGYPAPPDAPTTPDMAFREAQLLVHYLDYIFPLQYPYYKDEPSLGGRGWLFWLLMKRGPLHQAVLTLSALHHHTQSAGAPGTRESELIGYHTNALQRLRQVLQDCDMDKFAESRQQMVEFLACGSALISFELFRGGLDNWRPHLDALASVVNKILVPHPSTGARESEDGVDKAQPFLVTKVLWLDILASTATGKAPQTRYQKWLQLDQIDMSRLTGCRNWVMQAVGDISTISSRKTRSGFSKSDELQLKALEQVLDEGIERMKLGEEDRQALVYAITMVFATAALVQIETMRNAPSPGMRLYTRVARAIEAMEDLPAGVTFRGLAWPVATVGAVAASDQQNFFERAMKDVLDTSGSEFTNCGTVLNVLRRCWQHQRESGLVWTWQDGMTAMGICALLL